MMFYYNKLLGRIKEKYGTQENFAKELGVSATSLNYKLTNRVLFKQDEISKSIELLDLEEKDIPLYFFAKNIEITQQN